MVDKILIVDDDPGIRKLLHRKLARAGSYEITEAENGEIALQIVGKKKPNLILLDVMMPVMSGIVTCQSLRDDPRNNDIFIIMLTARAEGEIDGLMIGADDYVVKPFDFAILFARIKRGLKTAQEKHLAMMDETGSFYSSSFFQIMLDVEISRAKRYGCQLSLMIFSLDGIEDVEEAICNTVLAEMVPLLQIRKSDITARINEYKLILLLTESNAENAGFIANRLRCRIANHKFSIGRRLTASFGVASLEHCEKLLVSAEKFLLDAQRADTNSIVINDNLLKA